ncbi:MAG: ComF family protein [Desulfobacteraceae bacterium]
MRRFSQTCVDAAFPVRCLHCEQMYYRQRSKDAAAHAGPGELYGFGALMADYLCTRCSDLYEPVQTPLCHSCGRPFISQQGVDHECPDCLKHAFGFDTARASGLHEPPLKTLIHQFKYQGRAELARPLGRVLWQALQRFYDWRSFDLVLPVPLHWFRRCRRGFNQAALLLRQWAGLADEQGVIFNKSVVSEKVLLRRRHTPPQTGLGKKRRVSNLKNAFSVNNPKQVRNKRILLIDDVLTTGSTVDACSKVLKSAGAASIDVLTVARAV